MRILGLAMVMSCAVLSGQDTAGAPAFEVATVKRVLNGWLPGGGYSPLMQGAREPTIQAASTGLACR